MNLLMSGKRLPNEEFARIVRAAPLIAIDTIIRDHERTVLVGLRTNEPAKDQYFVPGGIIRKNERINDAFTRIVEVETSLRAHPEEASFLGAFEHFYDTNCFDDAGFGTHYVVLAYEMNLNYRPQISLDPQHSKFRWMNEINLIAATDVHPNTKAYFNHRERVD